MLHINAKLCTTALPLHIATSATTTATHQIKVMLMHNECLQLCLFLHCRKMHNCFANRSDFPAHAKCALLQQMSADTHFIFTTWHCKLCMLCCTLHILNQMQKCYIQQFLCGFGCIFNLQKPISLRASLNPKLLPILKEAKTWNDNQREEIELNWFVLPEQLMQLNLCISRPP